MRITVNVVVTPVDVLHFTLHSTCSTPHHCSTIIGLGNKFSLLSRRKDGAQPLQ